MIKINGKTKQVTITGPTDQIMEELGAAMGILLSRCAEIDEDIYQEHAIALVKTLSNVFAYIKEEFDMEATLEEPEKKPERRHRKKGD